MRLLRSLALLTLALVFSLPTAQAATTAAQLARRAVQADRVADDADMSAMVELKNHLPLWATAERQAAQTVDMGEAHHLTIVLARDPQVQAAFEQLLADQQNPASPLYHQWLQPAEVGELFGPTAHDIAAVTDWLTAQGLKVESVAPSRTVIEVSGTRAQVAAALQVNFGYFKLGAQNHLAPTNAPSLPAALAPVIDVIGGLTDVMAEPQSHAVVGSSADPAAAQGNGNSLAPQLTVTNSGVTYYFLTPNDFATIYDINSVYTGGNTGATIGSKAQHVAIIGRSQVLAADISNWATRVGISNYTLNTIIPTTGTDPGLTGTSTNSGDQGEQTLDVNRVIGTAPGAIADLVVSASSQTQDGVYIAAAYNVNTLMDPIMSLSYSLCEFRGGQSNVNLYNNLFATAASEGISVFVSSGDSLAAGCESSFGNPAANGSTYAILSINDLCSSSYSTCVGGTQFNDTASPTTYWSASNSTGYQSVLSYIPEGAWNEPTSTNTSSGFAVAGTGGGVSAYIAKPTWQTGTGVPNDNFRDVPDVSFSAAGHDGYFSCLAVSGGSCVTGTNGSFPFIYFSGTSASAPGMAGVAALVNTALKSAQGNFNPLIYKIANSTAYSTAFHDTTVASSGVTNCSASTASICNNSVPSTTSLSGGLAGYVVTTGYDQATGWGSLDVAKFIAAAQNTLVVTANPNPATTSASTSLKATFTPAPGTSIATGTITFYDNGTQIGSAATLSSNSASINYTFTTVGTHPITATYSGDTNNAGLTSAALALTVTAGPTFSVTPATTSFTLNSGATTGNTVSLTTASLNSFVGTVTYSCAVSGATGTAAGSCAVSPATTTLTSGGSGTATVTITTTPGTSGTFNAVVTGTSGSTVVNANAIAVTLNASTIVAVANPTTLTLTSGATTGNTSVVTFSSTNGFAGPIAVTCAVSGATGTASSSTCSASPASVTLTAGGTATSTLTLASTAGTSGTLTMTGSGIGTQTGATINTPAATAGVAVTLTTPGFTLTPTVTSVNVAAGASTNNTFMVAVAPTFSYTGTVSFTCTATNTSGTAAGTCSATPVTVTGTSSVNTTVTLTTTAGTNGAMNIVVKGTSGTISATAATVVANVVAPSFTLTSSPSSLAFTSGATTNNTVTITATPNAVNTTSGASPYAGSVALTCSISGSSAYYPPTCTANPTSLTLSGTTSQTATVSIGSTAATQAQPGVGHAGVAGGILGGLAIFAAMFGIPARRRALRGVLTVLALAAAIGGVTGCSGNNNATTVKSSAGSYTVTVTGTGTTNGNTVQTNVSFTLSIN